MTRSRALVGSSIATVVLFLAAAAVVEAPPTLSDSGADVVRYYVKNADNVRLSVFIGTFTLVFLMTALGLIAARLPAPERWVFIVPAGVYSTTAMIQLWFSGGLASHPTTLEPGAARTILDVQSYFGPVLIAASLVIVGSVLAAARRTRFPLWYLVIVVVFGAEQLIESITVFGRDGFTEPGGAMNLKLGAGLFLLWLAATGVLFGLRPPVFAGERLPESR